MGVAEEKERGEAILVPSLTASDLRTSTYVKSVRPSALRTAH